MKRTRWEAQFDKRKALNSAEAAGEVADSMEYRTQLVNRVHAGAGAAASRILKRMEKEGLVRWTSNALTWGWVRNGGTK